MLHLTVRYFAAAGEAAGRASERLVVPADATVANLHEHICDNHGPELARILGISALLIDGRSDHAASTPLRTALGDTDTVDVLPPFAGG